MNSKRIVLLLLLAIGTLTACNMGQETAEDFIEGDWVLGSYTDNQTRDMQQEADFQAAINGLKIDMSFRADGEFTRIFTEPSQKTNKHEGIWYLENNNQLLVVKVDGAPESKLLIVAIDANKLVLQLEENGIATTMTFKR